MKTPMMLHYGGIALVVLGVVLQVAEASQTISGPVGVYAGYVSTILGIVLHIINSPNATTPPASK